MVVMSLSGNSNSQYKVLLDADILEEAVLNRGGFIEDAEALLTKALNSDLICLYIAERGLNRLALNYDDDTANYFRHLFDGRIISTSASIQEEARRLNFADYESAIEHVCATELNLDAIVTLNPSNFSESSASIWTVADLEQRILLEKRVQLLNQQENWQAFRQIQSKPSKVANYIICLIGASPYQGKSTSLGVLLHMAVIEALKPSR